MRRVQAQQQLDQGGLAAAVFTDDKQDFPRLDVQVHRPQLEGLAARYLGEGVLHIAQLQALHGRNPLLAVIEQQVRLGRGEAFGQVGDTAEGDLCTADDRQVAQQVFQRPFHVQQHQHEAAHGRRVLARPERLQGQRQADHHEEQHGAEALGHHEEGDGAHVGVADVVGGALDIAGEHGMAARPMNAQFLGAFGNGLVVLLQVVFGVAGGVEALDALALGDILHGRADADGQQGHGEDRQRQGCQVTQAAEDHGHRDRQGRESEGEVADGIDVVGQYRYQAVGAVALDLLDRRAEHLGTQVLAQAGDDLLAHIVATDIGGNAAQERHQTQPGEGQDHGAAHAAFAVQPTVDRGQQRGDAQAADNAEHNGCADDVAVRLEQAEDFAKGATRFCGHETTSVAALGGGRRADGEWRWQARAGGSARGVAKGNDSRGERFSVCMSKAELNCARFARGRSLVAAATGAWLAEIFVAAAARLRQAVTSLIPAAITGRAPPESPASHPEREGAIRPLFSARS
ncbi:hypothetical protein D3C84_499840 [compost metagenome]